MTKNYLSRKTETILVILIISVALLTLIGWVFQIRGLLFLLSETASMKVNTALLIIMLSIAVITHNTRTKYLEFIYFSAILIVLIVASFTLLTYSIPDINTIDNLFVQDHYSVSSPGKMSRATALSFIFISLGLIGTSSFNQFVRKQSHFFFIAVLIIAFISLVSHVLLVPTANKTLFFQTMAIQTSIIFILFSLIFLLKRSDFKFGEFILGNYAGSRIMRIMFPFIILMPVLLTYFLINVVNKKLLAIDFGIIMGSVIYIIISVGYLMLVGDRLNKSDQLRKDLERQLNRNKRKALKVNLLQETHHRVKNNFQMVNSILSLQSHKFEDQKLLSALEDCQDRIRAMAMLHESMYQYGNFEKVQVQSFFNEIISPLIKSYSSEKNIELELNIEPEYMEMNLAIPIGLIINEMVTNSLKHAFPNSNSGKIRVELIDVNKQYYVLLIGDDGIGLDESQISNFPDNQSMGQELISVFTEQLNGRKKRLSQPGVHYSISFPKDSVNN